jgi:hypothetical protein
MTTLFKFEIRENISLDLALCAAISKCENYPGRFNEKYEDTWSRDYKIHHVGTYVDVFYGQEKLIVYQFEVRA